MAANKFIPIWLTCTVIVLHTANILMFALTLISYLSYSEYGIYLQFFLGCYQLAAAAIATFAYSKWKVQYVWKFLTAYWLLVLGWILFTILYCNISFIGLNLPVEVTLCVLPMLIAGYFVYITYRIYKSFRVQ
jgi:hypothetical protein